MGKANLQGVVGGLAIQEMVLGLLPVRLDVEGHHFSLNCFADPE